MAFMGVGGKGLIPGRSRDNWGAGYYYAGISPDLKDSLASVMTIDNEQGCEIFNNISVTSWLTMGADVQVIDPSLKDDTAVFSGVRTVVRF
jgi:porin